MFRPQFIEFCGVCTWKEKLPSVATAPPKEIEPTVGSDTEPEMSKPNAPGDVHAASEQLPKFTSTPTERGMPGRASDPLLVSWKPPFARIAICAGWTWIGPSFRSGSCALKPVLPD